LGIVRHGSGGRSAGGVEGATGGHPLPDAAGEAATRRLLDMVSAVASDVLIVVLLSGGGSALLVAPAPGLTLEDKRALTEGLLASGADIAALNTVRKHCSRVKGGGLARAAARSAGLWALLLSDVVSDDPTLIASGPTVADASTFREAARVLEDCLAPDRIPPAIRAAVALAGEPGVVLAAGTDGIDGPTAAAGACVDGDSIGRARASGLDPERALDATDSNPLLAATGDLVVTGPTGTNVADVVVALR